MTLGDGWPPFYGERPSEAIVETSQLYLAYSAAAILIGLLLVLPGVRGKERIFFLLRWLISICIGTSIIACLQGVSWHCGKVQASLPYRVNGQEMVSFKVGLMIGLTRFNVTLRDVPGRNLTFSEEFYFLETDSAIDDVLRRGLPFPIINVVEHFSVNRVNSLWLWGRRYWIAGHYGTYLLWTAFVSWLIANIMLFSVMWYGGMVLAFTGLLMLGANLAFTSINSHGRSLMIHLGYEDSAILTPEYGWSFWLCLSVGSLCLALGLLVMLAEKTCRSHLRHFLLLEDDSSALDMEIESIACSSNNLSMTSRNPSYSGRHNSAFSAIEEAKTPELSFRPSPRDVINDDDRHRGNSLDKASTSGWSADDVSKRNWSGSSDDATSEKSSNFETTVT